MTHKNHEEDHDKHAAAKPAQQAEAKAGVTPSGNPFPYTASINEPQTVSLPVPADVVVPKPVISSIDPTEATIGDADFTLDVSGENFFADSVIFFAGQAEPTTYNAEEKTLSTTVKPSLWTAPAVVQCEVKNGPETSNAVDFNFIDAAEDAASKGKRRR